MFENKYIKYLSYFHCNIRNLVTHKRDDTVVIDCEKIPTVQINYSLTVSKDEPKEIIDVFEYTVICRCASHGEDHWIGTLKAPDIELAKIIAIDQFKKDWYEVEFPYVVAVFEGIVEPLFLL